MCSFVSHSPNNVSTFFYMILHRFLLLLFLLVSGCTANPTSAAIPPGETWTVPDNESWRKYRIQLQSEYAMMQELMRQFPADKFPEVHFYCSARAFGIAFAYGKMFGVTPPPHPQAPQAQTPSP